MKLDTLRGHLDALVLAVLEPGPLHGYAIISTLRARSGGTLDLPTGTIYPALRRLERAEYVSSDWSIVGGRKRRTYELTAAGRRALASERDTWKAFSNIVGGVLGTD
ncbi:PadR family transcriptional regulator [Sphaerisporangium fuscum]|uniref:PadR family transcriptional regulator n=1 Tax=Sphaerisporangium fuscum TaxID=2835868 RepID=UPI001BDC5E8A|nr:helix-turn-helix transcriptional regulator [Sphaerisporangium fuscum]